MFEEHLKQNLAAILRSEVKIVLFQDIQQEELPSRCVAVCALELEGSILSELQDSDLAALQILSDTASTIIWLQCADVFRASKPDSALVRGLSRTLVVECL